MKLSKIENAIFAMFEVIAKAYKWTSMRVLKPYFNIETPYYKQWWKRHAKRMQMVLDFEHETNYATKL